MIFDVVFANLQMVKELYGLLGNANAQRSMNYVEGSDCPFLDKIVTPLYSVIAAVRTTFSALPSAFIMMHNVP